MATLYLVGLGPGSIEQMTQRAQQVVRSVDAVVGYGLYVRLVRPLLDNQDVIRSGMTKEWQRADEAIELVQQGKNVALVCSGDSGVYAMAPLVFEIMAERALDFNVEVVPGVTAAISCASLVGAPMGHDSCTISLSDLLTPWQVIEKRIEAAAIADFVITFYNPRSKKRVNQIEIAKDILLKHRSPDTPVAVIDSAYRDEQKVQLTTLKDFTQLEFAMSASVIVGNSNSYRYKNWIVTPRGYQHKYDLDDGAVKEGQRPGRTLVTEPVKTVESEVLK
ncbi:precorrin-3B C(17)-methyltransferase [Vibrio sp. LaRot3]|uniref:precorrin-3B C(17)-methyltransferase n=1 Tax=Vibrio sp. LaRot3 TaxID=2998829 RepID=UPI0022CDD1D1|nr:precorrin-3B C(17)-methyltransferase [Vibrio sp. LaRot3]MDA0149607.1 precorrin-3B C(17)-methyltransferase [Vibrio sp. LaRot3]